MAETNRKKLVELMSKEENLSCADCGQKEVAVNWASTTFGVFLCLDCVSIHRKLGTHLTRAKSVVNDDWDDELVKYMERHGNLKATEEYQKNVPPWYKVPDWTSPDVLKEQWIRAKYERLEFHKNSPPPNYIPSGIKRGHLHKLLKKSKEYKKRLFVLSIVDFKLRYYKEGDSEIKRVEDVTKINVTILPRSMGSEYKENGLKLALSPEHIRAQTRIIYLYAESGKECAEWYNAIRQVKYEALMQQYPSITPEEVSARIMFDSFEGHLVKSGPRLEDGCNLRWFILQGRKLMYYIDLTRPHPKGEIEVGSRKYRFDVKNKVPPEWAKKRASEGGHKNYLHGVTLKTPGRTYYMWASTEEEAVKWMIALQKVINKPLTPEEEKRFDRSIR